VVLLASGMKTILILLGVLTVSASAQNPELLPVPATPPPATFHPLSKPGSTSLARPSTGQGRPTSIITRYPTGYLPPATPAPGPRAGTVILRGTVQQRTATGLLVKTAIPGDGGLVWLTGVDLKTGMEVEVVARKGAAVNCPTAFGDRMLDGYAAEVK